MKDQLCWEAQPPWDVTSLPLSLGTLSSSSPHPPTEVPKGTGDVPSEVTLSLAQPGSLPPEAPAMEHSAPAQEGSRSDQTGERASRKSCHIGNLLS